MYNLILAPVWLLLGLYLLYREQTRPPQPGVTPVPLWAFAFVLAAWNLVRWWASRTARRMQETSRSAFHQRSARRPGHTSEPDPNFDFSQPGPAPQPPATNDQSDSPRA